MGPKSSSKRAPSTRSQRRATRVARTSTPTKNAVGDDQKIVDYTRLLKTVVEGMPAGVIVTDENGRIQLVNLQVERLFGYMRDEMLGHPIEMLLPKRNRGSHPDHRDAFLHSPDGRAVAHGDFHAQRKDGSDFPVELGLNRVKTPQGVVVLVTVIDITERKRAESALRHSEKRFRSFVEATANVIWRMNAKGDVDQPIPFWNEFTGQSDQDAFGAGWLNAIHPDDRAKVIAEWQSATSKKATYEVEYRLKDRSGEWRYILARGVPVTGPGGNILEYIGTSIDISAQKHAEASLRESEHRFRMLADNISQLAWICDSLGDVTWYNRRWLEYTGLTFEDMKGWGWGKVHHPDHIERVVAHVKQSQEAGVMWEDTFPLRGKNGEYRWFLSRAFPIRDAEGRIVLWFGTNTDITDLRDAQMKVSEREAVLRTVTNEARVGLVMVDERHRYMFANQAYGEILGLPRADIIGRRVADVLPAVYEDQIKPRLDRAFSGERVSYELHVPHQPKDGKDHFFEVTYEPRGTDGARYVVVVIVDITERKKAQATLERMVAERTAELRQTNEQMEAFVYSIAHDLRAPLRAMQGYSQILLENKASALPEDERGYLTRIHTSAEYMDKMILDLLAFGRTASGEVELGVVDVESAWDAAVYQCNSQIEQTKAVVEVKLPLATVRAHEPILVQVLANLLSNSMKFVQPGVTPCIRFWSEEISHSVRLFLQDNGIGIQSEHYERIFRVFERIEGSKYPGTGIGLSIVRKGIERMNGQIGLNSEVGKGTCFWIELPKP